MGRAEKFWDRMAKGYAKSPVADETAYQKKLQVTREYFEPHMQVLEFGCGTGSTAIAHAPYVAHIQAIDISSKMIAIAQGKADEASIENVSFRQSTLDECEADQSWDAVLGLSILHLLDDREAVIAKVHHMLKPGGCFVSSTICLGNTSKFFKVIAPVGKLLGLTLKVFTTKELQDNLTDAGFVIDYQWQPDKGPAVFIVARKPC